MGLPANKNYESAVLRRDVQPPADLAAITGGRNSEAQPASSSQIRLAQHAGSAAGKAIAGAQFRARTFYADLAATTQELMARAQERARSFRRERPMQALATIAAAAFACGIVLRIWRSQKS